MNIPLVLLVASVIGIMVGISAGRNLQTASVGVLFGLTATILVAGIPLAMQGHELPPAPRPSYQVDGDGQ